MSNGGILQLAAIGNQDYFLTSNPQLSFLKKAYKRHTNFAIQSLQIPLDENIGSNNDRFNKEIRTIIPRKGNLLHRLYLTIDLQCKNNGVTSYTVNNFINSLIKNASIKIGGRTIDEYQSQYKQLKSELLTTTENKYNESDATYGGKSALYEFDGQVGNQIGDTHERLKGNIPIVVGSNTLVTKRFTYIFDFWFTRNIGQSLPLDALSNHDIELIFNVDTKDNVIGDTVNIDSDTFKLSNMLLYGDYIFIDGEEKRRFEQSTHEYLIEQVQYAGSLRTSEGSSSSYLLNQKNYNLTFLHPVKYLIWGIANPGTAGSNKGQGPNYFTAQTTNSLTGNDAHVGSLYLQFNGQNRMPDNNPIMNYTRTYPHMYLNHIPPLDTVGFFSFALNPFEEEPSGTCNFSRIKDKLLITKFANNNVETIKDKELFIFAVNYNVFRIASGMGGLLFSS